TRKTSKLIRLIHRGFDWKNHLKKDIASVFKRIKLMDKHLIGKEVDMYNIYITEHEPVDSWDVLKKPMVMKDRKPIKMNVFYITDENFATEKPRLLKRLNTAISLDEDYSTGMSQETTIQQYKHLLTYL